jgi:hypothetical protein
MNNQPVKLENEEDLLLKLCRQSFNEADTAGITDLVKRVNDWKYFLHLSNIHGIEALAYHNFKLVEALSFIPQEVSGILRNSRLKNLVRNEFNLMITAEAARLLGKEGIPVVLLKGMALEQIVYGNKGIRQMSDVDILVPPDKCIRARQVLLNNEFQSLPLKSIFHRLILRSTGKHLPSLKKHGGMIEIHHDLFGDAGKGLTSMMFEKSREIMINGQKVLIPGVQILFLYLVRHLWLHEQNNESQLRLYTDLVVLADNFYSSIFEEDLPMLAAKAGIEEPLASRLMILEKYLGITFPDHIDDFIRKRSDPDFENKFLFFLRSPKGNPQSDKSWYYSHFVSEIPGFHRKIIFILGDLFPTISFMKRRYRCSGVKALMYYPHRWGKLTFLWKGRGARGGVF